jgi:hypothetical protein
VHIGGMCKGSGMIHPNMATMLGVVTTDAAVDPGAWRAMLKAATDASFNAVRAREGCEGGLGGGGGRGMDMYVGLEVGRALCFKAVRAGVAPLHAAV